jgi:hypothetical protein
MTTLTYILAVLKAVVGAVKFGALVWRGAGFLPAFIGETVSPLALRDEDFMFLHNSFLAASGRTYYPPTAEEVRNCKSLCNSGVLRHVGGGYKLTWANRYLVKKT